MKISLENALLKVEEKTKKQICVGKFYPATIFETTTTLTGTTEYSVYSEMPDKTWQLTTEQSFEAYIPMPADKNPLTTPHEPVEYESEQTLWNEVKGYVYKHVDLIDERAYDVLTGWIFASWIGELFDSVAYLGFFGRESVGKSRALEVLNELCFRAWHTTGLTTATLFRLVERFTPTLLLDESEFLNTQERRELISLLNAGQRRGIKIPRMKEDLSDVEFFSVFCPKALGGTQQLKKTTTSRMITFTMTRNTRPVPKKIDRETGATLRSTLLMWRFRKLSQLRDNMTFKERVNNPEIKATTEFPELEPLSGRSHELFYPIIYSAPTQEIRTTISDYANELEDVKLREDKTQLSSLVFETITNLNTGLVHLKDIVDRINEASDIEYQVGPKTVAKICTQLGFKKMRTKKGIAIVVNPALIERLRKDPRYSLLDYGVAV